jgi:hypothetical protein
VRFRLLAPMFRLRKNLMCRVFLGLSSPVGLLSGPGMLDYG